MTNLSSLPIPSRVIFLSRINLPRYYLYMGAPDQVSLTCADEPPRAIKACCGAAPNLKPHKHHAEQRSGNAVGRGNQDT